MEIDNFTVEQTADYWELYFGRRDPVDGDLSSARHGLKIIHIKKETYFPDERFTAMLLERLNGFPKAIEFLIKLRDAAEDPGSHSNTDTVELINEFLDAVPHRYTKLSEDEPKPRPFTVKFEKVMKGSVEVVATTRDEAERMAWESNAQEELSEQMQRDGEARGEGAVETRVVKIQPSELEEEES